MSRANKLDGKVRPGVVDFPWDCCASVGQAIFDVEGLIKRLRECGLVISRTSAGDIVSENRIINSPKNRVVVEYPKKYAFNASRESIFWDTELKPYHEVNATWKNDGSVWYIDSLTDQYRIKDEELHIDKDVRVEMRVPSFQPNAKVPPETFTLAALEMPPGARILDQPTGGGLPGTALRAVQGQGVGNAT